MTPPGNALRFDGADDYLNVGHGSSFNLGSTFTVVLHDVP